MYTVMGMSAEGFKGVAVPPGGNEPLVFETAEEAWEFIENAMKAEPHLRFMWVKEIAA